MVNYRNMREQRFCVGRGVAASEGGRDLNEARAGAMSESKVGEKGQKGRFALDCE